MLVPRVIAKLNSQKLLPPVPLPFSLGTTLKFYAPRGKQSKFDVSTSGLRFNENNPKMPIATNNDNEAKVKTVISDQQVCRDEPAQKKKFYYTLSIDGNISSGKSTLVTALQSFFPQTFNFEVETVLEPIDKWTNLKGHNLLDMLYKDSNKNNFLFQHYVQLTRLNDTIKDPTPCNDNSNGKIRIMERSIQNNRYCFTELARRLGHFHEAEFSVIAEWYKWLEENVEMPLDLIIYLRTSPETVFERMKGRGRTEESTVPLEYLKNLHETYEDWLFRGTISEENNRKSQAYHVICIDANRSKTEVAEDCKKQILSFLHSKM